MGGWFYPAESSSPFVLHPTLAWHWPLLHDASCQRLMSPTESLLSMPTEIYVETWHGIDSLSNRFHGESDTFFLLLDVCVSKNKHLRRNSITTKTTTRTPQHSHTKRSQKQSQTLVLDLISSPGEEGDAGIAKVAPVPPNCVQASIHNIIFLKR